MNPKKAEKQPVAETALASAPASAPVKAPDLVAYYAMPAPQGVQSVATPIGGALAHDDGQGFTLQLHLMPPVGAHIILRKPQVKKTA